MVKPKAVLAVTALATASVIALPSTQGAGPAPIQELDDGRQWFEGRMALTPSSPPLMRAAAASAFNETADAEKLLRSVIRSQPRSDTASRAHELLSRIYLRSGRYKRLIDNLDAWARAFPAREEVQRERSDIEQFRGLPDQVNGPRRRSMLRHAGDIFVPVSVNGRPARYFFDTGAWVSAMSQTEALRVGLETRGGSGALSDSSGRGVQIRMGVAKDLILGSMRFRDVSFAVLPDQEGSVGSSPESGGILGMPILLAGGVIRWSKDGTVEFGGPDDALNQDRRNLVFYRNRLVLRTSVLARPVFVTVDTGAVTTDLNGNFSTEFAELIARMGTKDRQSITGVGGTTTADATRLPEVVFQIGTTSAALRPAIVTEQRTGPLGGDCCVANVGLDLLTQGRGFMIDFSRMTLRLD